MSLQDSDVYYKDAIPRSMTISFADGTTSITNVNICQEQMTLEESLCSDTNLRYGCCEASCFTVRIVNTGTSYKDKELTVTQEFEYNNNTISVVYGHYKVFSDKPSNDRVWRDLVCYDVMYDIMNKDVTTWLSGLTFPMTMSAFRNSFFTYVGVTQETTTLINDSFSIPGGFYANYASGKTIIEAICELNGVFGHINNSGNFEYISLPSAETYEYDHYINGTGEYEDYVTDVITGIKAKDVENDVGTTVGTDTNQYVIESNPLIYGTEGTPALITALTNLLNKIGSFSYRPFKVKSYGNPMLPIGSAVKITTKYQTINSFMMKRELSGIQALRDTISATGDKTQPSDVNSTKNEIIQAAGKVHTFANDIDSMKSEIYDGQGNSKIEQTLEEIVLKVDSNGNIVKVELGQDASTGQTNLNLNANTIHINSDTIKFDNDGYVVSGDVYESEITPQSHEIKNRIAETMFPVVPSSYDLGKATKYDFHYFLWNDRNGRHIKTFNLQISNSSTIQMSTDETTGNFEQLQVVTGRHYVMFANAYNSFKQDGGTITDGVLVFPSGHTSDEYIRSYQYGLSFCSGAIWSSSLQTEEPIIAYMDNWTYAYTTPYPLETTQSMVGNGVPVVIAPNLSVLMNGDVVDATGTGFTTMFNNKVSKSGDTMTGILDWTSGRPRVISSGIAYMEGKNSVYTLDKTSTNSTGGAARTIGGFYCRGKDDTNIGVMTTVMGSTGNNYMQLTAYNKKTNGDSVSNYFRVFANKDGTHTYSMASPASFREALSLGTLATMSNCNKVTSNGAGNKTAGYLMHGVGTSHDYAIDWTSSSTLRFWVDTQNVQTLSDKRLKSEIQDVDMRLVKAIGECKTYQYKAFNRGGNISVGIMAQELVEKCKKYGVEPMNYELLSQMEFKEDDKTLYYHIEYEQYLVFRCLYLENKMAEIESRLSAIEAKLDI